MGIKDLFKSVLLKNGYKVSNTKYVLKQVLQDQHVLKLEFDHVLSKYLLDNEKSSQFSFVQIGAFDGIECDPLRKYLLKYDWKGIMLEPQPAPFERLRKQYNNRPNLAILNAALSKEKGKTQLYILEGTDLPEWTKGMASFDKQNILKHRDLVENLEGYIKKIEIETISFQNLFSEHAIEHLDLLQIDTEGFDAEIIRMFPFSNLKPSIIHFESKHIPKDNLENLLDYLVGLGYDIAPDRGEDMLAVLRTSE